MKRPPDSPETPVEEPPPSHRDPPGEPAGDPPPRGPGKWAAVERAVNRLLVVTLLGFAAWLVSLMPWPRFAWRLATSPAPAQLTVPVPRVSPAALRSSFGVPRAGGRLHHGIDILAARGTEVVAAAPGLVTSTTPNRVGGTVIWVVGAGGRLYYYAHLDGLHPDTRPGRMVEAGGVLGTVGDTGNAQGGPPHLHFGIYAAGGPLDPTRCWPVAPAAALAPDDPAPPRRRRSARRPEGSSHERAVRRSDPYRGGGRPARAAPKARSEREPARPPVDVPLVGVGDESGQDILYRRARPAVREGNVDQSRMTVDERRCSCPRSMQIAPTADSAYKRPLARSAKGELMSTTPCPVQAFAARAPGHG